MSKRKFKKIPILLSAYFLFIAFNCHCAEEESPLFWPPPPADIRITFVKSVYSPKDIGIKPGLLKKLKAMLTGEKGDFLNKPVAIAIDSQKTIYICDAGNLVIYIYDQKNKEYKKIAALDKEELLSPVGIAVSDNGSIFVSDSKLEKVFCLNKDGKIKFTMGKDKALLRPTGLAVHNDKLYIVDTLSHAVSIFDLNGNFIAKFGKRGSGNGELNYPTSIAIDSDGKIYVVDTLNFKIEVFDRNNDFLYAIGKEGDGSGSFSRPKGIALDSFGHIYATDGMFDNFQVFGQKGEFLLSLGEPGKEDAKFWIPSGIAIDNENYIYVADSYNQRIQIFHYVGKD